MRKPKLLEESVSHPPPGQNWPSGPEQNQPPYGGYSGERGADPGAGPYGSTYPPQQPYGEQNYGYPQESYTTEPPYSGQPYSGQPYSGAPQSGPPTQGYDPGYQQPGYAPGQPYQQPGAPPSFAPPPQRGRNRGALIAVIGGAVVLVLLLCVVGAVLLTRSGGGNNTAGPTTGATTPSSAPSASPSPTAKAEYPATIVLPNTIAGMTKVDDPQLNQTANETAREIQQATNATTAIAGYYSPPGDRSRIVGIVGVTAKFEDPSKELDDAFTSLGTASTRSVDPGPLGGVGKCGTGVFGGQTMSICGWADGGSLALGIFPNRTIDESAQLLRQIRGEILRRG